MLAGKAIDRSDRLKSQAREPIKSIQREQRLCTFVQLQLQSHPMVCAWFDWRTFKFDGFGYFPNFVLPFGTTKIIFWEKNHAGLEI